MFNNAHSIKKKKTHSKSENRKPIQALGPPLNVIMFAQIPGTDWASSGILVQRSGLKKKANWITVQKEKTKTNLNSIESSPHIDLSWLIRPIGMNIV